MQHSIAAKYAARPLARFVTPTARARMPRLGLRAFGSFQPAPSRATVLRRGDFSPYAALRSSWRAITPARVTRPSMGVLRPLVTMRWANAGRVRDDRAAAAAPWRA
jgi:hypothetical protein